MDILVEDKHLLIRDVTLPKLGKRALSRAVALNVQSSTPFDPTTVAVGYKVLKRDRKQTDIRQYILRLKDMAHWSDEIAKSGTVVRSFAAKSAPNAVFQDNHLQIMAPYKKWHIANGGLAAALAILLGFGGVQHVWELDAELQAAEAALQGVRAEVAQLSTELNSAGEWTAGFEAIIARQGRARDMVIQMDALSEALPDTTWVSELSFEPERLLVTGNTTDAPNDFLSQLAAETAFETAQLLESFPLSDGTGQQRFELEIRLVGQ
ncbi:MAG: PilN domain-containing protein [Pseudomonadota bacterium]